MGRITTLRDLIGVIKDKASLSKAALIPKPNTPSLSINLALLRATTHSPSTPPHDKHLSTLLSLGDSSRATASALIQSLMDRLQRTHHSSVALKCLLTIHHIMKRGPFILQDQLSVFPATGGRNYLNLSAFHDGASATTWALSAWVRWYSRYLETLLTTYRFLGFFLSSTSSIVEREKREERVSSFTNLDLIRDVGYLVAVTEEICKVPDSLLVDDNKLIDEVMGLVGGDYLSAVNEILMRVIEFKERLSCVSFDESVELVGTLKRLEDCKERLMGLFTTIKKASIETLWVFIEELIDRIGMTKAYRRGGGKLANMGTGERGSESARFGDRVLNRRDSVRFSSARFNLHEFSLMDLS